jgi:hypothetical protein
MSQRKRPNLAPNIGEALGPFLQLVSQEHQPLLIALAERMAAERYREWASQTTDPAERFGLLACGDREDEIARRVESLYPDAATIQAEIVGRIPNLADLNRSLFAPYALHEQFALQAQGERLGAATWRSLARKVETPDAAEVLLSCAPLEEESAVFLESLLDQ